MNDEKKVESYTCQICSKNTTNSVDAVTHYLDHGSSALNAINTIIKNQRTGSVTPADTARVEAKVISDKKVITANNK